jgi:amino-acid N-acetyltransferase
MIVTMKHRGIRVRRATPLDQPIIRAMVHAERLNPADLNWANFMVAVAEHGIVGAAQMRRHPDGSRELGSLVVARELRGHGIAKRMIDALLAAEPGPVWMIAADGFARACARWGFRPIDPRSAPVKVRRNWRMGSLVRMLALIMRRPMGRLVILERLPVT